MTGKVPEWARQDMRKTAASTHKEGVKQMGSLFHGAKPKAAKGEIEVEFYADGGEVETLKQEGLKASEGEKVGFFERLRMGNIDDPKSEAYTRFGAGRGQEARMQKQEDARDSAMAEAFKNAPSQSEAKAETESRDMDASQQTTKPSSSTFGSAFAAARKAGQSTFSWNGKSYNTKMKGQSGGGDSPDMDPSQQTYKGRTEDGAVPNKTRNLSGNRMGRAAARKRDSAQ